MVVKFNPNLLLAPQSRGRLDRGGLPSETLTGTCPVPPKRDRRGRGAQCKRNHLAGKPRPMGGSFKSGSLERGESAGGAEGAVLWESAPWVIAQMCRFKFSPERPPRSWA
jgi:hypothetical protein